MTLVLTFDSAKRVAALNEIVRRPWTILTAIVFCGFCEDSDVASSQVVCPCGCLIRPLCTYSLQQDVSGTLRLGNSRNKASQQASHQFWDLLPEVRPKVAPTVEDESFIGDSKAMLTPPSIEFLWFWDSNILRYSLPKSGKGRVPWKHRTSDLCRGTSRHNDIVINKIKKWSKVFNSYKVQLVLQNIKESIENINETF